MNDDQLDGMVSDDFLIATQSSPIIVAQLMAWNMLKQTADWPPESISHMKQMADAANYCMGKLSPV